jgi:hypothetical protein
MVPPSTEPPQLRAIPVVAWLLVLLSGLVGLILLASAFTNGGLSHLGPPNAAPWWNVTKVYLAFLLPAALVLGVGIFVARLRYDRPIDAPEWTEPTGNPAAGHPNP